jgi:opacity protein-like surface antigen
LLYVLGGFTRSKFSGAFDGLGLSGTFDGNANGFTIGGGVESAIADNITAKLEYRYTTYGRFNIQSGDVNVTSDSAVQTIRGVLSYHTGEVKPYHGGFDGRQWTGLHIGAGAGMGLADHVVRVDALGVGSTFNAIGGKGFLGTVEAGFDYQLNDRMVLGVMGDYTRSAIASKLGITFSNFLGFTGGVEDTFQATDSFSLLGRAGVLSSPNVLWYGQGGLTHTQFEAELLGTGDLAGLITGGATSQSTNGITVGAGVEAMIMPNVSWKTEYRYTSYDTQDIFGGLFSADSNIQSVRSVLSYRF